MAHALIRNWANEEAENGITFVNCSLRKRFFSDSLLRTPSLLAVSL
jgi:hypothetical protein